MLSVVKHVVLAAVLVLMCQGQAQAQMPPMVYTEIESTFTSIRPRLP
jgi:uncharacterized Zn-finger protein